MYLSWRIWLTYLFLFAVAIPWYWQWFPAAKSALCFGLPLWVCVAIAGSFVISCFTALLLLRPWPDENRVDEKEQAD